MSRSALAQHFFPLQPAVVAGYALAGIILHNARLRSEMERAGWLTGRRGYSAQQVEIICRHMAEHPSWRDVENIEKFVPGKFKLKIRNK